MHLEISLAYRSYRLFFTPLQHKRKREVKCYTCQLFRLSQRGENFILEDPKFQDFPRMTRAFPKMSEDFPKKFRRIRKRKEHYTFAVPVRAVSPHTTTAPVFSLLNRESRDESTIIFMDFSILALVGVYIYFKRVSGKYNSLKF